MACQGTKLSRLSSYNFDREQRLQNLAKGSVNTDTLRAFPEDEFPAVLDKTG